MAEMEKKFDDLIIINLYSKVMTSLYFWRTFSTGGKWNPWLVNIDSLFLPKLIINKIKGVANKKDYVLE